MARELGTDTHRARLHRCRQRSGALRGRAAHAGARTRDHRAGARRAPSSVKKSSITCRARNLPVPPHGAAYSINRGLWGVTHRRHRDADLARQHSRTTPGCSRSDAFDEAARGRNDHVMHFEHGVPGRPRRTNAHAAVEVIEQSRDTGRARSASAAAFTWATPSSAPRAASHSRRRRPKCC
jgi:hypothetical protein